MRRWVSLSERSLSEIKFPGISPSVLDLLCSYYNSLYCLLVWGGCWPLPEDSAGVRETDRMYGFTFISLTRVGLWLFGLYLNPYFCCPLTQGLAGMSMAPIQRSAFQPFPIGSPLSLLGTPSAKLLSRGWANYHDTITPKRKWIDSHYVGIKGSYTRALFHGKMLCHWVYINEKPIFLASLMYQYYLPGFLMG